MHKRNDYIYRFMGRIQSKTQRKGTKKYNFAPFYQLNVMLENSEVEKIFAFSQALPKPVWNSIKSNDYLDKKYLLLCKNTRGSYRLVDWEILPKIKH